MKYSLERVTVDAVRNLVIEVPEFAAFPIRRLNSSGTDNILFMLGDRYVVRFPRRKSTNTQLINELDWIARFRGLVLEVPKLIHRGYAKPFHCEYGIYSWIDGAIAVPDKISNPQAAANTLAEFLKGLQEVSTAGAPLAGDQNCNRGVRLKKLTHLTLGAIKTLSDEIDTDRALKIWEEACDASFKGQPVWVHGDLKADNLIAASGDLRAVIDWGLCGVGDPAIDYSAAWTWVDRTARQNFLDAFDLTSDDRARAKGWALYCAAIALSYYRNGLNEDLSKQSRYVLFNLGLLVDDTVDT